MSKDPLEELFGPAPDEPQPPTQQSQTQAQTRVQAQQAPTSPMPARQRLAHEQAERVRTTQPRTKPIASQPERGRQAMPWIIVGLIVVIAIIVSLTVVNAVRGGQDDEPSAKPVTTTEAPTTTPEPETTAEPDEEKPSEEPEKQDQVPKVDVGMTSRLQITQWGVTGELSQKLGMTSYVIENNNTELRLDSPLIQQFPCDGYWGVTKTATGKFEVLKPAERCAAAPEVYDELWGLTDAFVRTIK